MGYITDLIILIVFTLLSLLYTDLSWSYVLCFLIAFIIAAVTYLQPSKKLCMLMEAISILGAFFFPPAILFFPVLFYPLLVHRLYWISAVGLLAVGYRFSLGDFPGAAPYLFLIFGLFLAWLLQRNTQKYSHLKQKYKETTDDNVERNLLLAEKNQALIDKQDSEIQNATLQERNRIAREIHDNVGHLLSRSILMLGAIKTINQDNALKQPLETLDASLNDAMTSIRNSVHDLHDDAVNVETTLDSLTKEFTFCPISLHYDMESQPPKEVKYALISIVKESLANIMKHSNATQVIINLREHPALYQLTIEDNGTDIQIHTGGIGLQNMKERVAALGGMLRIQTERGFYIFITIPKR